MSKSNLHSFVLGAAVVCGLAGGPCIAGTAEDAIAKFDKDNDKTLDLAEVKAAATAQFAKLDKDNDGTLDANELKGVVGPATFKAADPDNDGTLSKDEYLALAAKLLKSADTDHDGTVDAAELGTKTGQQLLHVIGG